MARVCGLVTSVHFHARRPKTRILNFACNVHSQYSFDELLDRDLYSLNSLIASYVRNSDAIDAWDLFRQMRCLRSDLDAYTFTPILNVCSMLSDPDRGNQVHGLLIKTGTHTGIVTQTALMDMYSKFDRLGDSLRIFEEMKFKDVVTWNAMASNFLQHGLASDALGVFEAMRRERIEFSEFTLCSMLKTCASLKALKQGKQVHGLVVLMGRDLVVLGTALIDFYSSVEHIDDAVKVFSSLNCRKDDAMHNSLISGCIRNQRYKEAFSIMCMVKPNVIALTIALAACSENSDLWTGKQIHCVAIRQGFTFDTQLCNVLLDMYAKCGKLLHARALFDGICNKDVISWTSMIDAYGSHGHGLESLVLFRKMREGVTGVLPNSVTFLAVLSACGHSGLVEQGRECLILVREKYGLEPGPEHYACFIDILGRAGKIDEAWCLFHNMIKQGTRPTVAVWTALLNACTLNLDVTKGEFAAKNLLKLESDKSSNYVLLSNFYAAIGRWDSVDELRNIMRMKGLTKETGNSWISILRCHEREKKLFA
ncbi:Pentatricopeptide repeat-containing protein [Quillaja saponaria]|uniref:Pentatricopeptide repeat-containing protein n=1 Tax=Quillaja saponaria TaxID=32244 RepID=A0AAD7KR43_QUISA|nr:Pentatricopeptide repeat-containing protein [Quillaja saponaria]